MGPTTGVTIGQAPAPRAMRSQGMIAQFEQTSPFRVREPSRDETHPASETELQGVWQAQRFSHDNLRTVEGQPLVIHNPGVWNHGEGPDFRAAELSFNGRRVRGDIEIHFSPQDWQRHGHHGDRRYEGVILHVICAPEGSPPLTQTARGRGVPHLNLGGLVQGDTALRECSSPPLAGRCIERTLPREGEALKQYLKIAGETRLLERARRMGPQIEALGPEAVLYRELAYGHGLHRHRDVFRSVAAALPYERARQLAREHPLLLEAAYFQLTGRLNPECGGDRCGRLRALREAQLPGLRPLAVEMAVWGVRPLNHPERRLGALAGLVAATADTGLLRCLERCWEAPDSAVCNRSAFEALFPAPPEYWLRHCRLGGPPLVAPAAVCGEGLRRAILGNAVLPFTVAWARALGRPALERQALALFRALPREATNRVVETMLARVVRPGHKLRLDFQMQQGLLHMQGHWCGPNPTCEGCGLLEFF